MAMRVGINGFGRIGACCHGLAATCEQRAGARQSLHAATKLRDGVASPCEIMEKPLYWYRIALYTIIHKTIAAEACA
jgi:hypothetical protein